MANPLNSQIISIDNPLLRAYAVNVSILVLKMFFVTFLTTFQRIKRKAFWNPEDAVMVNVKPRTDENVERVRRAHLNDLENIPIFFVIAFLYILTDPPVGTTRLLFSLFTIARCIHTFVYGVCVLPQPARALSFIVGVIITGYMALSVLFYFL